jgi:hypothetical protein
MEFKYLVFSFLALFFLIRFLNKTNRYNYTESNSNNYKDLVQNIEFESNSIESEDSIGKVVEHPIKNQNSFLYPNDDFGTFKKGVVIDNQTYEYEGGDNNSNFIIIEPVLDCKGIIE